MALHYFTALVLCLLAVGCRSRVLRSTNERIFGQQQLHSASVSAQCLLEHESRMELGIDSASLLQTGMFATNRNCGRLSLDTWMAVEAEARGGSALGYVSFLHTPFNFIESTDDKMFRWQKDEVNGAHHHNRMSVWVSGYARSATSTVLSMVNAAGGLAATLPIEAATPPNQASFLSSTHGTAGSAEIAAQFMAADHETQLRMLNEVKFKNIVTDTVDVGPSTMNAAKEAHGAEMPEVYAVFEPCHNDDKYSPELAKKGCHGVLNALARCDFQDIEWLHGNKNPHSTQRQDDYTPTAASASCAGADLVTIKTIDYAHDLKEALPILDNNDNLLMIDVIRDPRGIYASWKATYPFSKMLQNDNKTLMTDICDSFAKNLKIRHPRLRRIVFEHLVEKPKPVMEGVFDFIGVPFGDVQLQWINSTFNSDCDADDKVSKLNKNYRDCHSDSTWALHRWERELSKKEKDMFSDHEACREVAWAYNFPLDNE